MLHNGQINQIITALIVALFRAEEKRLRKRELDLVSENRKASGGQTDGFFYQGLFYTDVDHSGVKLGVKASLHPSLVPSMASHVKDRETIEFDKRRVKQALALILRDCKTTEDLRDALPNQLAEMIDQVKGLPRTRPEGFTVLSDPRKYKQYQSLREKIEFYTVTKLLY